MSGSFFESVPGGADVYLMSRIIHDWDDPQATAILKTVRRAMKPGAKLLLAEQIVPADTSNGHYPMGDITMLVLNGSQERTEAEFAQLFAAAGLKLSRVIPRTPAVNLIEAVSA